MSTPQTTVPSQPDRCVGGTVPQPGDRPSPVAASSPGLAAAPTPATSAAPGVGAQTIEACQLAASTAPTPQGCGVGWPPVADWEGSNRRPPGGRPGLGKTRSSATCTICQKNYNGWHCPNCGWW